MKYKKITLLCLSVFSVLGVIVRFYHINYPVADWHSWRQSDTAAVAGNFLRFGTDPLHPRYDDLSNIQSGKDNPEGYRMVEFPLYQLTAVYAYKAVQKVPLVQILRIVSILSTGASIFLLGFLLAVLVAPLAGIIGALLYAFLPFSIFYGRAILPDPFGTFWALLSLVLLYVSGNSRKSWILVFLASVAGSVSVLVRPMEIFVLTPGLYFLIRNCSRKQMAGRLLLYGAVLAAPLLLWRQWILRFPEGIPVSDWLYNKDNVRFKGAWFYWLFARRIGELILGWWGLIPFGLGLIAHYQKKEQIVSLLWLIGALGYLIIFAGGNVQHDYYQALIIPVIIWFLAKGVYFLVRKTEGMSRVGSFVLAAVSCMFLFAFSWYTMRTYFWINRPEIVEAGKTADAMLPKNAKVIAPYNGDTTFLFQTGRQGWPLGFDIDKKIAMGAGYYVTVSPTDNDLETRDLANMYTVLVRNDKFAIIDLTRKKK